MEHDLVKLHADGVEISVSRQHIVLIERAEASETSTITLSTGRTMDVLETADEIGGTKIHKGPQKLPDRRTK